MKKQIETICPDCNNIIKEIKYYDNKGLVEKNRKCGNCGHHYNWSFGHVFINEKGDVE